jgi:hypothetical protein
MISSWERVERDWCGFSKNEPLVRFIQSGNDGWNFIPKTPISPMSVAAMPSTGLLAGTDRQARVIPEFNNLVLVI